MAWANKYRFRFDSVHGVEYNIYIQKDGYSGQVIQRKLGRAPILKKKQNGPICGTSLELWAECAVDGEYAELYTSDPKEYKVEVYRAGSVLIWTGFVSTELYSEPSIAPPYDVQIVATDGLGELKLNNFSAMGEASLKAILMELLSYTGSSRSIYFASNLKHTGGSNQLTLSWTINIDFLDGKTCYEVLTQILESLHATITTYNGNWLIARETDIETLLNSSGGLSVVFCNSLGVVSTLTLGGVRKTVGKKGVADMWPNGNLSTSIEPARRSVVVKAPFHYSLGLPDPKMLDKTKWQSNIPIIDYPTTGWEGDPLCKIQDRGFLVGNDGSDQIIYKTFQANNISKSIIIKARGAYAKHPVGTDYNTNIRLYATYRVDSDTVYYGTPDGWKLNNSEGVYSGGIPTVRIGYGYMGRVIPEDFELGQDFQVEIPPVGDVPNTPGTLGIVFLGNSIYYNFGDVEIAGIEGYQDTIKINNGARGESNEVEIIGGRVNSAIDIPSGYQGVWKYSGTALQTYSDSLASNADFLAIQALGRAVSVALARTKTEGLIDFPSTLTTVPLIIRQGQQDSWVNTWEWDLLNEDVRISSLSVPNASISIESETIEEMTDSGNSSTSGGSGGSSLGGGSSSGGASIISMWRSLTNEPELNDYDAATKIAAAHLAQLFTEVIVSSSSKYLKLNTDYDGLVSDGFITAGASASASDARLKEKIRTIQPEKALMILAALRGCEWVWNDKYQSLAGQRGSGLIAQEVQSIMPWAVLNFNDELSLNYNSFWGIAIPVMQSQQKHIEKLERMVNQLEKTVEELKNELKKCR